MVILSVLALLGDTAWVTAIGVIISTVITYFVTKSNNKKELAISDRMQLSKDQYQLIAELRQMMQEQRDEIESLREEIRQLQAVNINLTVENRQLQQDIKDLTDRLDNYKS